MKKLIISTLAMILCLSFPMTTLAGVHENEDLGFSQITNGPTAPSESLPFSDIAGHKYQSAITQCEALGIVHGDGNGAFRPDDRISEAELYKMLAVATAGEAAESIEAYNHLSGGDEKYQWARKYKAYIYGHHLWDYIATQEAKEGDSLHYLNMVSRFNETLWAVNPEMAGNKMTIILGYKPMHYWSLHTAEADKSVGLYKGISLEEREKVRFLKRGEAAQMVVNFINLPHVQLNEDGTYSPTTEKLINKLTIKNKGA